MSVPTAILCIRIRAAEPDQLRHRDAQVRVLHPGLRVSVNSNSEMQRFESRPELRVLANSDSEMQSFESCHPSQPVRL